jgi:sugar porter (SP) family MFS transporter
MTPDHLALVKSNIVSVYQAGAFFGALSAYASNFFIGRKKSLYIYCLVFILGAAMMLGANSHRGLGLIMGGRVLAGFGVGGCSMVVPIYISEMAPPAVRGRLVGIYELGWQIGGLVGFWINYGISETIPNHKNNWLIPFAVQLIPGGILFFGTIWLRESPRWLFNKGRRQEALRNLCWMRNLPADHLYIVEEVAFIDAAIEEQRASIGPGFWGPFKAVAKSKSLQWRMFLGAILFMWQNGSGINAINYYSPTVFASIGISGTNTGFLTTGIFGVVKTALTIIWLLYLIDRLGRRRLLMIGAIGGSLCMWYIGAYIKLAGVHSSPNGQLSSAGISAIFFFYLWTAFYTPSWNGKQSPFPLTFDTTT